MGRAGGGDHACFIFHGITGTEDSHHLGGAQQQLLNEWGSQESQRQRSWRELELLNGRKGC